MANGIIIIDKPADWTSQDVTAKLRGVFHERRIGHGGTLDPMATGVLPVFVGRATRGVEFFESAEKEYEATLRLGVVTNTQDTTGEVVEENEVCVPDEQLLSACRQLTGEISQLPPMYSAIKVNGKKLYELARKGQDVERRPRTVTIFALDVLSRSGSDVQLRIRCSKGTYIRTLCHDLGRILGCGGCMAALRRTQAGQFTLAQSVTLPQLLEFAEKNDPAQLLMPVDALFSAHPVLIVTMAQAEKLRHGAEVRDWQFHDGTYRVFAENGEFLLLGEVQKNTLKTVKSFFEV